MINAFTAGIAASAGDMPVPGEKDLPGAEFLRDEVYVGGALWGLINGGADLYFEYGFDRMALQEILWQGEFFRLELSRMTSPAGAWGICSVSRHGCAKSDVLINGDCLNRYQYQLFTGNYYLSLINYSGRPEASELAVKIGRVIASKTGALDGGEIDPVAPPVGLPDFPEFFMQEYFDGLLHGIKFLRGRLGLQNVLPSIAHCFSRLDNYRVYYLQVREEGEQADIMLVKPGDWDEYETESLVRKLGEHLLVVAMEDGSLLCVSGPSGGELQIRIVGLVNGLE